jgi:hypothetical protein
MLTVNRCTVYMSLSARTVDLNRRGKKKYAQGWTEPDESVIELVNKNQKEEQT